jgi:hypothetical protein
VAYTIRNPVSGYCQGMNFVVGKLALVLSEEEAFWVFAMLMERILPVDYYSHLLGVHADCYYLGENLVRILLPKVYKKFKELNQSATFYAYNWFICLFQDNFNDRVSIPNHNYVVFIRRA